MRVEASSRSEAREGKEEKENGAMQIKKNHEEEALAQSPMRSEQQMYDLILNFAKSEERIRAVTLEGSRTNRNIPADEFQDYDITFFVTDMDGFTADDAWLDVFGERQILQKPEDMELFREVSKKTACLLGYSYPDYDEKISGYVKRRKERNDADQSGGYAGAYQTNDCEQELLRQNCGSLYG